ncbi:hypothetical protein [Amycolatopsis sp.]|nr:hypothetical protein [Amycolatopsis sp.]HET6705405.1 hypothetical protein [Amycolatopsis sp.]
MKDSAWPGVCERLALAGGTMTTGPKDGDWRVPAEVRTWSPVCA